MNKYFYVSLILILSACATSPKDYSKEGLIVSSDCYGILDSGKILSIYTKQDLTKLETGSATKIGGSIQIAGRGYQQFNLQIGKLIFAKTYLPAPSETNSDVIHSISSIKGMIQYSGQTQVLQMTCENHYRWPAPKKASGSLAKLSSAVDSPR